MRLLLNLSKYNGAANGDNAAVKSATMAAAIIGNVASATAGSAVAAVAEQSGWRKSVRRKHR